MIIELLDKYVPNPKIPLHYTNTFTLLISVMLSANTTDKQVNKATKKLFKIADNPKKMASLTVEEIKKLIHSCGLANTKAKNIKKLSNILMKKYKGKVPKTRKALEALPGVGHKTASVILMYFGVAAFPVDTHIFRCSKRWGLSKGKTPLQVEKDLKKLFPKKSWRKLHLQIIEFGKTYCKAKCHHPKMCPICSQVT